MAATGTNDTPSADRYGTPRAGLLAGLAAFGIWGLLPLYLHPMNAVPAPQIIAHRVLWSCVLVFAWLALRGEVGAVGRALADPASRWRLATSAVLVSINWLVYVWAVNAGHVVEASLGYFINPLLNVALGVVVLRESLNRAQWSAVALATAGVVYLSIATGRPPWIALVLAASFASYGFIRKVVAVESVPGLATETLLLAPFALGWLLWCEHQGSGAFLRTGMATDLLLVGCGLVTALPLALFAYAARLIPLSTVGLLQYLGPTLQFLVGVLVFHEAFPRTRAIGFIVIWSALAIYAADSLWRSRKALRA
jgi:chloramphenicol-sensitive protein RarD